MPLSTEVGLGPGDFVSDGDPAPPQKRGTAPIVGPCLLWLNGWMHQDTTSYGGRPQFRRHCVRWGPSSRLKGAQPSEASAHVCCGQMAGWIKMPLGMEVDLGPGHTVLDGDPAPRLFDPCLLWPNGCPSQLLLSSCSSTTLYITGTFATLFCWQGNPY